MTVGTALGELRDLLARETGSTVRIGLPSSTGSGLSIWPYRAVPVLPTDVPPRLPGAVVVAPRPLPLDLPLLVVAHSPFTDAGLAALDAATAAIHRNPVLGFAGGQVRLTFDHGLDLASLAALFANARLRHTMSVAVTARVLPSGA